MYAVAHVGKLDSVLTRVFIQFTTVSSVMKEFDFAALELYSWQSHEGQQGRKEPSALQIPDWFGKYLNLLLGFSGSVPSLGLHQVLECLVIKWGPKDHRKNLRYKRVLPYVFWLVFPITTHVWVFLLAILIVKLGWPVAQRIHLRKRRKFIGMLIQVGATPETADAAVATDTKTDFIEACVRKQALPSIAELTQRFGLVLASEIVAHAVLSNAECLPPFLHETTEDNACTQKQYTAKKLREMLTLEDFHRFPLEPHKWSAHLATYQTQSRRQRKKQPNVASEIIQDHPPTYSVFGLFRDTKFSTILRDIQPALFIALFSIWELVTRRYFLALQVHVVAIKSGENDGVDIMKPQRFWLQDMDVGAFEGDHFIVSLLGIAGLVTWSLGVPISTYLVCRLRCERLQEFGTKRLLGFFYVGLEPKYYYWELCVKRADVLVVFMVAYTHVLPNQNAKLIAYMGLAGISWVCHTTSTPYDNIRGKLVDRTEYLALQTRHVTFFMLNVMLLMNGTLLLNSFLAAFILGMNGLLILRTALAIISEIFCSVTLGNKIKVVQRETVTQSVMRGVRALKSYAVSFLGALESERSKQQHDVPVVVWYGMHQHVSIWTHDQNRRRSNWILHQMARRLYCTDDHSQRISAVDTLCAMFMYVMTHGSISCWPSTLFDTLIVLPIAIRRVQQRYDLGNIRPEPTWIKDEIIAIMNSSASDAHLAGSQSADTNDLLKLRLFNRHADFEYHTTADDLALAQVYLQTLSTDCLLDVIQCGSKVEDRLVASGEVLSSNGALDRDADPVRIEQRITTSKEVHFGGSRSIIPEVEVTTEAVACTCDDFGFQGTVNGP